MAQEQLEQPAGRCLRRALPTQIRLETMSTMAPRQASTNLELTGDFRPRTKQSRHMKRCLHGPPSALRGRPGEWLEDPSHGEGPIKNLLT